MHRELAAAGLGRATADYAIFDASDPGTKALVGRLTARGLSDELNDRHYAIIDGLDGRTHYVDLGDAHDDVAVGSILQIRARQVAPREVDRTIARIAEQNGGRYSAELHQTADPSASREFVQAHVRRLEAMRRLVGAAGREADGSWRIAPDHPARAAEFDRAQARKSPVIVESLSKSPLSQQIGIEGPTWLDRTLAGGAEEFRETGFGREANDALALRRRWLVEQDLASERDGRVVYRPDILAVLAKREIASVGRTISKETGLRYVEPSSRIDGVYRRSVDLTSGKFAVIEKSREFTLVPWRPVLERYAGRAITGTSKGDSFSWRTRGPRGPDFL